MGGGGDNHNAQVALGNVGGGDYKDNWAAVRCGILMSGMQGAQLAPHGI